MFSQQPDQKNLMLAIVLSMGVLLLWQYFYAAPKLKEEQERQKRAQQTTSSQVPGVQGAPGTPGSVGVPSAGVPGQVLPPGAVAAPALSREDALKSGCEPSFRPQSSKHGPNGKRKSTEARSGRTSRSG